MPLDDLAHYFMATEKNKGEDLFQKDAVSISNSSDTQVDAYIRASGAPRVSLISDEIGSLQFRAQCNCTRGKKGRLCRHIWATILVLDSGEADFLACKSQVEMGPPKPDSEAVIAAKARQEEYKQKRKEQNKAWKEKIRQEKKKTQWNPEPTYPANIEAALHFFANNGFELKHPIEKKELTLARKTLAHVFHPDKGGTHQEILDLNENHDLLINFLGL